MRDRNAPRKSQQKSLVLLGHLDHRVLMELTGVADGRFHKYDRYIAAQPMHAADLLVLFRDRVMPGPVRNEHGEFQVPQRVPEKSRVIVDEIELVEPQLGAPPSTRDD